MRVATIYMFVSLIITIAVLHTIYPHRPTVTKYPDVTLDVSDIYVDDQNVCYRYHRVKVA